MNEARTICIDIDGTICEQMQPREYHLAEPLPGARESLERLHSAGWTIVLHTGRHILHADVTHAWLKEHGMRYDHLVLGKPPAVFYIDDRAVRFASWEEMDDLIQVLEVEIDAEQ